MHKYICMYVNTAECTKNVCQRGEHFLIFDFCGSCLCCRATDQQSGKSIFHCSELPFLACKFFHMPTKCTIIYKYIPYLHDYTCMYVCLYGCVCSVDDAHSYRHPLSLVDIHMYVYILKIFLSLPLLATTFFGCLLIYIHAYIFIFMYIYIYVYTSVYVTILPSKYFVIDFIDIFRYKICISLILLAPVLFIVVA